MKKIVSVFLLLVLVLANGSAAFAATAKSSAPTKAQTAVIAKYLTAVETGNVSLIKSVLHPSVKLLSSSTDTMNRIKDFIDEQDGYVKHFGLSITKDGAASKTQGQGFKLKGYLLTATPAGYSVIDYTVYVYLLDYKGTPKFVTEKTGKSVPVEDPDTLSESVQTKVHDYLTKRYGEDYFDLLDNRDNGQDNGEDGSDIDLEDGGNSDDTKLPDVSGTGSGFLTAQQLIDKSKLTYKDLKYSDNKFVNNGSSLFSQITVSDITSKKVSLLFENTGTANLIVSRLGGGGLSNQEATVKAKSSKVLTFDLNTSEGYSFTLIFDKEITDGKMSFTLSDLKVYTENSAGPGSSNGSASSKDKSSVGVSDLLRTKTLNLFYMTESDGVITSDAGQPYFSFSTYDSYPYSYGDYKYIEFTVNNKADGIKLQIIQGTSQYELLDAGESKTYKIPLVDQTRKSIDVSFSKQEYGDIEFTITDLKLVN